MNHSALGIDLASRRWADIGSAMVALQPNGRLASTVPAMAWPSGQPEAKELARLIDTYCRDHGVHMVGLDGPHAWKNPLSKRPGAGRWSEYMVRAQGKPGQPGYALPRTQLRWTQFCIEVFDALLAKPDVCLAQPEGMPTGYSYAVMETYPTATWKALGLSPLPGLKSFPGDLACRLPTALATMTYKRLWRHCQHWPLPVARCRRKHMETPWWSATTAGWKDIFGL